MHNQDLLLAPSLLTGIETLLLAAAVGMIFFHSRRLASGDPAQSFLVIERVFARLARRQRLAILVVGTSVIVVRVALIPILGVPQPAAHDEFSYLLAADTFAHGRLTNSTHPMGVHFETFHVIQKPTYMSIFPPAQGLVLAAGQLLGNPWLGQLLATALMCSSLCWMLQAWVPPRWALLGAFLAVLRLGVLTYWMNGYWSASIVALGGALVLGAWPRIRKHGHIGDALLLVLGVAILANSRPFEGLVFALPVACAMLVWLTGEHRPALGTFVPRIILPMLLAVLIAACATGYYYYRVTGNPFRMTYRVSSATYGTAPYFIWQTLPAEPELHDPVIRGYYRGTRQEFAQNRTFVGYLVRTQRKLLVLWQFYLGSVLTLPLLALPAVMRQRKMRLPIAICAAMAAGFAVETYTLVHYFAPAVGALYILLVQGMRHLSQWSAGRRRIGRALVRAVPVLACAMILLRLTAITLDTHIEPAWPRGDLQRAAIAEQLQRLPGRQLVLVSYDLDQHVHREWVYNDADIDASKVAWARDMGAAANQELLAYMKDRRAWRVNGDASSPQLEPYEAPAR
jgi:hypothetical protein